MTNTPTIPATDTTAAVIARARAVAERFQHTPGGYRRLSPDIVALVDAVLAHDRAAVTCLSCGAPWGQPHNPGCEFS